MSKKTPQEIAARLADFGRRIGLDITPKSEKAIENHFTPAPPAIAEVRPTMPESVSRSIQGIPIDCDGCGMSLLELDLEETHQHGATCADRSHYRRVFSALWLVREWVGDEDMYILVEQLLEEGLQDEN